ncbi:hypothetical protein RGAI101_2535 [Roseobacter sp. GAI101]|nr:hypothetical protein RGAI101_2535 [Roseobacter sp. GAI101]
MAGFRDRRKGPASRHVGQRQDMSDMDLDPDRAGGKSFLDKGMGATR